MPRLQLDDVANTAKDAAYVSVGLGVIAFQRLQVRRNELNKLLGSLSGSLSGNVGDRVKVVEERLGAVLGRGR